MLLHVSHKVSSGFTLIEMLTSIAVFSLLMILLFNLTNTISHAWLSGQERINNFSKARAIVNIVSGDIHRGIFRADLPNFRYGCTYANGVFVNGTYTNAFYTRLPGSSTSASTTRNVTLVGYGINLTATNIYLRRANLTIPWTGSGTKIPFQGPLDSQLTDAYAQAQEVAGGILDFEMLFIHEDGTSSKTYVYDSANRVISIGIGLVIVDDSTIKLLGQKNQISSLHDLFTAAITGSQSMKYEWETKVLTSNFYSNPSYPRQLANGLKTFEFYVSCSPF
jgi:prepilin-type N-terminal cleavage/methylation domain-containing protein